MPSVGIMSMQRIHNYGSSLQAYGLRKLLETNVEDARVRFVDFEPGPVLVTDGARSSSTRVGRAASKLRQYNDVDAPVAEKLRFFNHKRRYGTAYFPMLGIPPRPSRDLDLDVQVIGSDEVFNCVQSNTNVGYSRDLFGHASPARRLISYAGSFGNTTLEKIEQFGVRRDLEVDLARFASISVRDRNSATIVEALTGRAPRLNVDPALAYDFMRAERRIPTGRQHAAKYLIVYGYSGRLDREEGEQLRRHARRAGLDILTFGGVQECGDAFVDCNPFELLAYFRDAEAVLTDTFHGTIFAIINNRPFATIVRRTAGHGYGNEEKLGHLLETFGLSDRRVDDPAHIPALLGADIEWDPVNRVLERERREAVGYLTTALAEEPQR